MALNALLELLRSFGIGNELLLTCLPESFRLGDLPEFIRFGFGVAWFMIQIGIGGIID